MRRDAARGEALGEALKDIAGTPLDKGVELDALAKLDPEQRAEVIDKVKRGEINATASEANASHGRRMFPSGSFHHPFARALRWLLTVWRETPQRRAISPSDKSGCAVSRSSTAARFCALVRRTG